MKNSTTAVPPRPADARDMPEAAAPAAALPPTGTDEATQRLVGLRASLRFLETEARHAGMKLTATLISAAADAALDETQTAGRAGAN